MKVGNIEIELEDIVHIFGSKVCVREEEQRRDGKHDTPNRQAIYLGESNVVKHGKKVAFIDYDDYQQLWKIGPTQHRHSKNCQVMNGNMILKTKPHMEAPAMGLEKYLDNIHGKQAPVYEVDTMHDKRVLNGEVEYKVPWKGYDKHEKGWEPKENLTEFGAVDMVIDFEIARAMKQSKKASVRYVNMNKQERAIEHLMGKPNLGGTISQHLQTYNTEMDAVIKQKLGRRLSGNEVKALKKQGT